MSEKVDTSRSMPSVPKNAPSRTQTDHLSSATFMKIVDTINKAFTLDSLFQSVMEVSPVRMASYHYFPAVGALDYNNLGRFYAYKIPDAVEAYFKSLNPQQPSPSLIATFARGQFVWLSDLAVDPLVVENGHVNIALEAMKFMGDGLSIPLFGPNNRRGYMFLAVDLPKKEYGPYFSYQMQALAQILHLRFCLMVQNLQKQIRLTPRESEVLELIAFGKTNKEIAMILNISVSTVAGYLKSIFNKLGVSDRVSASMRAQSIQITF